MLSPDGWPGGGDSAPDLRGFFPWTRAPLSTIRSPYTGDHCPLRGEVMELLTTPMSTAWPFPFTPQDWEETPPAVQAYVHTLHGELTQLRERVEVLEARRQANSTTSHRPPSSDSPYKKPRQRMTTTTRRKAGGKP